RPLAPAPAPDANPLRPRLAVFDFSNSGAEPRHMGIWTAVQVIPCFAPRFETVDRGELYWWLDRLGLSPRDVLTDRVARAYLARALNVHYLLFGDLLRSGGLEVSTYLLDAANGRLAGAASIQVQDRQQLRHRLGELAWGTQ